MTSSWDQPQPRYSEPARDQATLVPQKLDSDRTASARAPFDGVLRPVTFFRFIGRNIIKIALVSLAVTAAGVALLSAVSFPYRATATVLVDPRSEQVTLQENVLSSIGSDAAILESMVQIMKSDGFLLDVMTKAGVNVAAQSDDSEADQLKSLAKFKKNLEVERKGATYLVEVSYKDNNAQNAAKVANSVATIFAETQNGYLNDATENAARRLSERLVELRKNLNASEKAVADFAAEKGILYVDNTNTLQMRQLTELSAQLALAKKATEDARARYQQQIEADKTGLTLNNDRDVEPAQLSYLRQQRAQLMQTLEQQGLTYGPRHPRIAQTRSLLAGIDEQIRDERQLLTRQLKGALDVASAQQGKLEADVAKLSSGVVLNDTDEVKLEALRREAAADRDIYEKFLNRNKATDELAEIKTDNVRVVSPAVAPLRSSRPSTTLVAPVLALLGAVAATALLGASSAAGMSDFRPPLGRRRARLAAKADAQKQTVAAGEPPVRDVPATEPDATDPQKPDPKTSLLMLANENSQPKPAADRPEKARKMAV